MPARSIAIRLDRRDEGIPYYNLVDARKSVPPIRVTPRQIDIVQMPQSPANRVLADVELERWIFAEGVRVSDDDGNELFSWYPFVSTALLGITIISAISTIIIIFFSGVSYRDHSGLEFVWNCFIGVISAAISVATYQTLRRIRKVSGGSSRGATASNNFKVAISQ